VAGRRPPGATGEGDERVLRLLADKLDVFQTLRELPELSAAELRAVLLRAAERARAPQANSQVSETHASNAQIPKAQIPKINIPEPAAAAREPAARAVLKALPKPVQAAWQLFTDGASRGNPGPAGAGFILLGPGGEVVAERAVPLGRATNNVAEYSALLFGLEEALACGVERLRVSMDSELVVRQLSGRYQVKSPRLAELHAKVKQLLSKLAWHDIVHIERGLNQAADALANQAAAAVST